MRFCAFASGSSGNCTYAGSDNSHILVDVGISGKRVCEALNTAGLDGRDLDGILITHEHSDHICGLGVISRKFGIPIYATSKTVDAIKRDKSVGNIDESLFNIIEADKKFMIGDLTVNPMKISHDAADPVGYRISYGNKKVAVCTDLGKYDDYTVECLKGLDAVLLEANHDVKMLQLGPYPYPLKQRILGDRGHLSNELSGQLLSRILHDNMKYVFLGHLSKENNLPELAYEAVRTEVTLSPVNKYRGDDFYISVAKRDEMSELIAI
ncbi:MAG: MBL fold metallo-hydrolase [Lachnospiraceae bacterium]|nr:MBL fold metallo-hydrolase [Lachnospiraceae bacterium]